MDTQTGILRLTYNSVWGHYAFHWESNCGDFVEDDYGDVIEIIEKFNGKKNNPNWFIEKAESELDYELTQGNIVKGNNWCYVWEIEDGEINDSYFA
jgi:hypothetical protein